MNWKDYYTSYELSKKIQEIKGELSMDDPYWESPLTFIWLEKPNDDGEPYTLSSYTFLKKTWPQILQNHKFLPAYHILQDICCEYRDLFLDQTYYNFPLNNQLTEYSRFHIIEFVYDCYQTGDIPFLERVLLNKFKEGGFDYHSERREV